jgi:hypothetical protein
MKVRATRQINAVKPAVISGMLSLPVVDIEIAAKTGIPANAANQPDDRAAVGRGRYLPFLTGGSAMSVTPQPPYQTPASPRLPPRIPMAVGNGGVCK